MQRVHTPQFKSSTLAFLLYCWNKPSYSKSENNFVLNILLVWIAIKIKHIKILDSKTTMVIKARLASNFPSIASDKCTGEKNNQLQCYVVHSFHYAEYMLRSLVHSSALTSNRLSHN